MTAARQARLSVQSLEDRTTPSPAGDPDPAFGDAGNVAVSFSPADAAANALAVQPDGRILAAGYARFSDGVSFAVARLIPDGSLDPSLGGDGTATVPFAFTSNSTSAVARDVAVQPDGKVVLVGSANAGAARGDDFAVARLNPDGSLDPTFGGDGTVVVPFDATVVSDDVVEAVAVNPDGRIVLAGWSRRAGTSTVIAVARLNPDGTLDASFGSGGAITLAFPGSTSDSARDVVVQPDGKVVLAGNAGQVGVTSAFGVVRLNPDGTPDPAFGAGGTVTVSFGPAWPSAVAGGVALQPDGKVVLAGTAGDPSRTGLGGYPTTWAVARLNPDGTPDALFGAGGAVTDVINPPGIYEEAHGVAVQPDGKLVVGGMTRQAFGAARLYPDGTLDPAFGSEGKSVVPVTSTAQSPFGSLLFRPGAYALAVQADGKVLLGGFEGGVTDRGLQSMMAVVRLLGDPLPPPPPPSAPVLAGGPADGSAVRLAPAGGQLTIGESVAFFPGYVGSVRTAVADVTGDGVADLIGGAGPGGGPRVAVIDGATGARAADFFAFELSFTGGVFVAAGDLDGDGRAEVAVTPDAGGGPVVAVFDGAGTERGRFLGIADLSFRGGARVALGDVDGDGTPDLAVAAGSGGGPRVAIFDGATLLASGGPVKLTGDFFAFEPGLRNGVFVAAGDVTWDGAADLAFGGGPGGAPRMRLFDGRALLAAGPFATLDAVPAAQRADFFAGDPERRGGVRLALKDLAGDGSADLVTGSGEGEPSRVRVYHAETLLELAAPAPDQDIDPFAGAVLADGVFVG